jgi:allantoin racemase
MTLRIWYQSMTPLRHLPNYRAALERHAKEVCSAGTQVAVNGVSEAPYEGLMPADLLRYPYAKLVLQAEAIEFCRRAEREKFDAVILGSFSEPFLAETRSILEIPVVSLAEAAMLAACSLAEKFSLITLAPSNVKRLRGVVSRHGLDGRVSGVYALKERLDEAELDRALESPRAITEDFRLLAAKTVEAGADVVIPAEGVLNEAVRMEGLKQVEQATVLDSVGSALLYAEFLVGLKRRLGHGVGRRWAYSRPPQELLDRLSLTGELRKKS